MIFIKYNSMKTDIVTKKDPKKKKICQVSESNEEKESSESASERSENTQRGEKETQVNTQTDLA